MASIGAYAESSQSARRFNELDTIGTVITVVCVVLVIYFSFKESQSTADKMDASS